MAIPRLLLSYGELLLTLTGALDLSRVPKMPVEWLRELVPSRRPVWLRISQVLFEASPTSLWETTMPPLRLWPLVSLVRQ